MMLWCCAEKSGVLDIVETGDKAGSSVAESGVKEDTPQVALVESKLDATGDLAENGQRRKLAEEPHEEPMCSEDELVTQGLGGEAFTFECALARRDGRLGLRVEKMMT